ncbi:uncharacterized protein PHA67_004358 isoform 2-T2 [Liasis olivaceus]
MAGEVEEQWRTIEARTRLPPLPGTKKAAPKVKTSGPESSRSRHVCFNCGEPGHFAAACPKAKMEQGGKKMERKGPKSSKPGKESAAVGSETGARAATRGSGKTRKLLALLSLRQAAALPEKESSSREDSESKEMGGKEGWLPTFVHRL